MRPTRAVATCVLTAVLATTAGCAGQDPTTDPASGHSSAADHSSTGDHADATSPAPAPPAGADWNAADATYLTMMIAHHRQAVEMSELAAAHAEDPSVRTLAAGIDAGQGAEIVVMATWLDDRGLPVPTLEQTHEMAAMGAMEGMLTPDQLDELAAARGADFDRLFLERMIGHHDGALSMAATEMAQGKEVRAVEMATDVTATQTVEISRMRSLLEG